MSIEQALAENTAAIKELVAVWGKLTAQAASVKAKVDAGETGVIAAAGTPVAEVKPAAAEKPKAEKPKAEPKPEPKAEPKAEAAPALDYAKVGAAITAFAAANGRDATLAKLGEFGVTSGKALKPEQYADALAAFTATEEEVA